MANRFARRLRSNQTLAEQRLWAQLRRRQLAGFRFRRQVPISWYIVDFACHAPKLVIELDGGQHGRSRASDHCRDRMIRIAGYRVLRFWNHEVFENMEGVLARIRGALADPPSGHSPPS